MRVCPDKKCRNKLNIWYTDSMNFCPQCGKELVEAEKCKSCEAEILPTARFCNRCGKERE